VKLASLKTGGRDGALVVVSRDLQHAIKVPGIASTLQTALDNWRNVQPELISVYRLLNENPNASYSGEKSFALDTKLLTAPLPRAYQWADGSAYLNHVELMRRARGVEMPPSFYTDPLLYQGGSDGFLGPCDAIEAVDEGHGIDFEAEVAVITDDVPLGITPARVREHIQLLVLVNDVSLRNLIPAELAKGFGFFQSKPASSFSPAAVSPDELGDAWDGGRVHLPLVSHLNGQWFGSPNAGVDMQFNFGELIAHAAKTRRLGAGTLIGSGTVSNRDAATGCSCIAERRTRELLKQGQPLTPFMKFGDRIRIEMLNTDGVSIFGAIDQFIVPYQPPLDP